VAAAAALVVSLVLLNLTTSLLKKERIVFGR
jgi:hypothetical protein